MTKQYGIASSKVTDHKSVGNLRILFAIDHPFLGFTVDIKRGNTTGLPPDRREANSQLGKRFLNGFQAMIRARASEDAKSWPGQFMTSCIFA